MSTVILVLATVPGAGRRSRGVEAVGARRLWYAHRRACPRALSLRGLDAGAFVSPGETIEGRRCRGKAMAGVTQWRNDPDRPFRSIRRNTHGGRSNNRKPRDGSRPNSAGPMAPRRGTPPLWGRPTDDSSRHPLRRGEIVPASGHNRDHERRHDAGAPSDTARQADDPTPGVCARRGMPMRRPCREEHAASRRYHAARVRGHGPATDTHRRQLTLEQATAHADGWARRFKGGHVYVRVTAFTRAEAQAKIGRRTRQAAQQRCRGTPCRVRALTARQP
jgi:hypothetical protein